jgi:hypothetical protein
VKEKDALWNVILAAAVMGLILLWPTNKKPKKNGGTAERNAKTTDDYKTGPNLIHPIDQAGDSNHASIIWRFRADSWLALLHVSASAVLPCHRASG